MPSAAQIAPKLSPLGVNPKKVGEDVQKATKDWKGIKVMIELRVQNREVQVTLIPTAAAQVIKMMGEPPRDRKKQKIRSSPYRPHRKAQHQSHHRPDQGDRPRYQTQEQGQGIQGHR